MTIHRFIPVLIFAAFIAVAACGKTGDPVLPDGQKDSYPQS